MGCADSLPLPIIRVYVRRGVIDRRLRGKGDRDGVQVGAALEQRGCRRAK